MGVIGNAPSPAFSEASGELPVFARDARAEWFRWEPNAETSGRVARAIRQYWQQCAEEALEVAANGLQARLDNLQAAVRSIDLDRRLAPRLSARLATLMEAIERRDGYAVLDRLQAWCADPPEQWYADHFETESIAVHAWEAALLREIRMTQIPGMPALECFPLLEQDVRPLHARAIEAMELISQVDADMHAEIQTHVACVKLFTGSGIEGLSSPKAFGALWLKAPAEADAVPWFLEHLVHECSHLHLNALFVLDPLLTNPNEVHQAPIRPDPRPLFQVLHGTFVLARNCRVHQRLDERFPELNLKPALEKFREQLASGVQVISEHMRPTPKGQRLIESLRTAQ
jgi:HEXXH motif-containing protein